MIKKIAQVINEANLVLNEDITPGRWPTGVPDRFSHNWKWNFGADLPHETWKEPYNWGDEVFDNIQRGNGTPKPGSIKVTKVVPKVTRLSRILKGARLAAKGSIPTIIGTELALAQPAAAKQRVETEMKLANSLIKTGTSPAVAHAIAARHGAKF